MTKMLFKCATVLVMMILAHVLGQEEDMYQEEIPDEFGHYLDTANLR